MHELEAVLNTFAGVLIWYSLQEIWPLTGHEGLVRTNVHAAEVFEVLHANSHCESGHNVVGSHGKLLQTSDTLIYTKCCCMANSSVAQNPFDAKNKPKG